MQKLSKGILFASSIVVTAALASYGQISGNLSTTSIVYGPALTVQTINTGFGNAAGGNDSAGGSELDAGYGTISGGNLYLFLAGNTENNGNNLVFFVSGGAAGQSTLNLNSNSGFNAMNGSQFSPGFQATYAYDLSDSGGTLFCNEYVYGGSPGTLNGGYVGAIAESSTGIGSGQPSGFGNNSPSFASLALNNNHASTMGASGAALSGATSGANTTTGLELQIPLSQIGYTGGSVEVLAAINGGGNNFLSNQFLPGLPVGSGNVGTPGFNFSSTPGQFFTVVPEPSSVSLVVVGLLGAIGMIRRRKA